MLEGLGLKWEKVRPAEEVLSRLKRAATELTPLSGGAFHVVTHPFGKTIVCRSANLLFFHVGDGGRPSELLPLAITTDESSRLLAPTRRPIDFEECCELLGFRDELRRDLFWKFLLPQSKTKAFPVPSFAADRGE